MTREAAVLAKSWKELFKCKTLADKQAEPWYAKPREKLIHPIVDVHVPSCSMFCYLETQSLDYAVSAHGLLRLTPCTYELSAVLQRITREQADPDTTGGVIFLLDGSGSVSQGR